MNYIKLYYKCLGGLFLALLITSILALIIVNTSNPQMAVPVDQWILYLLQTMFKSAAILFILAFVGVGIMMYLPFPAWILGAVTLSIMTLLSTVGSSNWKDYLFINSVFVLFEILLVGWFTRRDPLKKFK
ncbi:hypothetical protein [Basilea psittacipulmonis]|uniref:Uncharacterized protein n=1 Tax=Basilea psittacipulmonis DSM 24701 TaxID=1072685 RepID=A0A077DEH7_9BURK|nr:hypothetical protein [Basilea psittacipulmonis]AIL33230.1 hypothetical protein IX83_07930 [Basilea psittacipulmonis DSM 24701]